MTQANTHTPWTDFSTLKLLRNKCDFPIRNDKHTFSERSRRGFFSSDRRPARDRHFFLLLRSNRAFRNRSRVCVIMCHLRYYDTDVVIPDAASFKDCDFTRCVAKSDFTLRSIRAYHTVQPNQFSSYHWQVAAAHSIHPFSSLSLFSPCCCRPLCLVLVYCSTRGAINNQSTTDQQPPTAMPQAVRKIFSDIRQRKLEEIVSDASVRACLVLSCSVLSCPRGAFFNNSNSGPFKNPHAIPFASAP